jgi:hypothetical protein
MSPTMSIQTLLHDETESPTPLPTRDGDDKATSANAAAAAADDDDDDDDDEILGYAARGDGCEGGGSGADSMILADPPASTSKEIKRQAEET